MKKKKVLILFCGGTLIMEKNAEGALEPPPKAKAIKNLLNMESKLGEIAELKVEFVENIDSANMNPEHWDKMTSVIEKEYDNYDGFVITHGTDSMAYTASALSYSLQDLGKPVVLTGAQIPGSMIETDARRNFVNAVRVAAMDISGVMIVFDEEIILGARSSKISESKLDAFETINWDLIGEIRIDIRLSDEAVKRHTKQLKVEKGFETNIAVITLFPGLPASAVEGIIESGIKGLILRAYGSGNISSVYVPVVKKAIEKNIPVVVDTQCLEGATSMHLYDVGKQALDAGVIQAYDMSIESVITKLMWILKREKDPAKVRTLMHTNFVGEINKEGKIY
jgi:L-asparaginase